jgi:hypothetical protein
MASSMENRQRRAEARQIALAEQGQLVPQWVSLPVECRREVLDLLALLLRSEPLADEETGDE